MDDGGATAASDSRLSLWYRAVHEGIMDEARTNSPPRGMGGVGGGDGGQL